MVSVPLTDAGGESTDGDRRGFGKGRRRDEPNFEALPDSLPPQNLEAEEAVLGGILLDPDAIGRSSERVFNCGLMAPSAPHVRTRELQNAVPALPPM